MVDVNDVSTSITKFLHVHILETKYVGQAKNIKLYAITCENGITFHVGLNLIFFWNNVSLRVLKNFPLLRTEDIDEFMQECAMFITKPLLPAPQVKELARKYLGTEVRATRNPDGTQTWIDYETFEVFVTADHIMMIGKKTRRVLYTKKFTTANELEEFFKLIQNAAKNIAQLDVH